VVSGVKNCAKIPMDTDNKALYSCLILNDGKMCDDYFCCYHVLDTSMVELIRKDEREV